MPTPEETAAIVRSVQRGDAEAYGALVRAFLRPAYAVALALVGRPADAEDVAQEALLRGLERIGTCREPARFGAWLLQIVRNEGRNHLRSRRRRDVAREAPEEEPVGTGPLPEDQAMRRELLGALAELTEVQREVVLLHDLEGWTHGEIASALACTETSSRQHLFQARRRLRARLGGGDAALPQASAAAAGDEGSGAG